MKKLILLTVSIIGSTLTLSAQTVEPAEDPRPVNQDARPNILRQIGLSPEQARQIRQLNMERRPLMEAAQQRLREANRDLDGAIYADTPDESAVQARLKELQLAQAEVIRLRSMNEFAIRRILTPEQLTRFREMRERFEMVRDNVKEHRRMMRRAGPSGFDQRNARPFKQKGLQIPKQ